MPMLRAARLLLAAALAGALLCGPAKAGDVNTLPSWLRYGLVDSSGNPITAINGLPVNCVSGCAGGGGGGGGSTGSVTAAGTNGTLAQAIQGINGGIAVPISALALPLPSGASTSAKQAAPGSAGTPSADVLSVQGVVGGAPQATNLTQINGGATATGSGASNAQTLRVINASDSVVAATGNIAAGVADSGSPVKVGGVYVASPAAMTDGQRGNALLDQYSRIAITFGVRTTGSDAVANAIIYPVGSNSSAAVGPLGTIGHLWNGSLMERAYSVSTASSTTRVGVQAAGLVPLSGTGGVTPVTVGTTSAQALAAVTRLSTLMIQNVSASASVACSLGGTAALNTAGSFQIAAGQNLTLSSPTYVPGDAINCIASAASTPVTIFAK